MAICVRHGPLERDLAISLGQSLSEFGVVRIVGDGLAVLEGAAKMKPDVCVLDISMPKMSEIEAAAQLRKRVSG